LVWARPCGYGLAP